MNSNLLHSGDFYAWHPYRQKGRIPLGAAKVKVLSVRKQKSYYEKNRRTEVQITVVEVGTGASMSYYKEGETRWVSTREIIDFWDSYQDETEHQRREQEKREYERKKGQVRKETIAKLISSKLKEKGFPDDDTSISIGYSSINLGIDATMQWLGISEGDVDRATRDALGPAPEDSAPGYTTAPFSSGV
jgi:hypothetical protein